MGFGDNPRTMNQIFLNSRNSRAGIPSRRNSRLKSPAAGKYSRPTKLRRLLLALFTGVLFLPSLAAAFEPFTARYTVSHAGMVIGESERRLVQVGKNEYRYSAETQSTGVAAMLIKDRVSEQSRFRLVKGEIRALEYRYHRRGGKREKLSEVRFDWVRRLAQGSNNEQRWQVPLKPGVHDGLLYQLAASHDLQRGRKTLRYQVPDEGELKSYDLAIASEEILDTPLGRLATVRVERDDGKREATLWLAKSLNYLPVRIDYTEGDGRSFSASLQAFSKTAR